MRVIDLLIIRQDIYRYFFLNPFQVSASADRFFLPLPVTKCPARRAKITEQIMKMTVGITPVYC